MTASAIRTKLYDYIRVADDKKLKAIYHLLENEISETADWWQNKDLLAELDARDIALETGADKGITIDALKNSIATLREKRHGK